MPLIPLALRGVFNHEQMGIKSALWAVSVTCDGTDKGVPYWTLMRYQPWPWHSFTLMMSLTLNVTKNTDNYVFSITSHSAQGTSKRVLSKLRLNTEY